MPQNLFNTTAFSFLPDILTCNILPFTHISFIASYCCTISHGVNIGCQDLGSTPQRKQEMSDTARCLEESFLQSSVLCFNTSLVFNSNNLNNFSTTLHHLAVKES